MTEEEINRLVKIHTELFKGDKYMFKCIKSDLDYLNFTIDNDNKDKK